MELGQKAINPCLVIRELNKIIVAIVNHTHEAAVSPSRHPASSR